MATPARLMVVRCTNLLCEEGGKVKSVGRQYLGSNLYLAAPVVCGGCGLVVRELEPAEIKDELERIASAPPRGDG